MCETDSAVIAKINIFSPKSFHICLRKQQLFSKHNLKVLTAKMLGLMNILLHWEKY